MRNMAGVFHHAFKIYLMVRVNQNFQCDRSMMLAITSRMLRFHWRGTHFDGSYTYDSKDLWVAASTSEEEQVETLFKGLLQCALSQIDKHSEELALQRISDQVISTVDSIFSFVKTDIPELYKPWTSTSSNHSSLVGTPLFICISKRGVVFYSDNNKPGIFLYCQTPIQ